MPSIEVGSIFTEDRANDAAVTGVNGFVHAQPGRFAVVGDLEYDAQVEISRLPAFQYHRSASLSAFDPPPLVFGDRSGSQPSVAERGVTVLGLDDPTVRVFGLVVEQAFQLLWGGE